MITILAGLYLVSCVLFVLHLKRAPLAEETARGFQLIGESARQAQAVPAVERRRSLRRAAPILEEAFH